MTKICVCPGMSAEELHPPPSNDLVLGAVFSSLLALLILSLICLHLYRRRKHNKKKYRVADHSYNLPDPALESLSGSGHIISNGKVIMDDLDLDLDNELECDNSIMTVTFSPSGCRLQTETNLDIDWLKISLDTADGTLIWTDRRGYNMTLKLRRK